MDFKYLQRVSLLDYPGKMAAICFTGGCNLRCGFCYNRDLVIGPESLPSIPDEEVLGYLESRRDWLDGVVITGGEPTLHPDLPEFMRRAKSMGYSIKLDTNGSNPEMLEALIGEGLVDYVALDIKAPLLDERYHGIAGAQANGVVNSVRKSIEIVRSSGVEYEFRTTVVPDLSREDLLLIAGEIKGAKRYFLQQFISDGTHVDERYSSVKPYPLEFLQRIQSEIKGYFGTCGIRGARRI
jgi:pyruvate formate lyase activating enzyme